MCANLLKEFLGREVEWDQMASKDIRPNHIILRGSVVQEHSGIFHVHMMIGRGIIVEKLLGNSYDGRIHFDDIDLEVRPAVSQPFGD